MATVTFYTYLWLREDGTPYYVGKGSGQRAFWTHRSGKRLKPPPKDRIILQNWPCEADAFLAETFLIQYYGRIDLKTGPLHNLTDGGEGATGWKPPVEWKEKIGAVNRGKKFSEEHKRKIGLAHLGRPKSLAAVEASRRSRTGMKQTPEHAEHSRTVCLGRKLSAETRRKISEGNKGKVFSAETRLRMSVARRKVLAKCPQ